MRNHTLMQTIARANRVVPHQDNGLIVDYVGVFRDLEKALAIYGAANIEAAADSLAARRRWTPCGAAGPGDDPAGCRRHGIVR